MDDEDKLLITETLKSRLSDEEKKLSFRDLPILFKLLQIYFFLSLRGFNDLNWLPEPRIEEHPDLAAFLSESPKRYAEIKKMIANELN